MKVNKSPVTKRNFEALQRQAMDDDDRISVGDIIFLLN